MRCEATALSSFGVAFLIGFGTGHHVLLRVLSLPCCVPCGSLGPQTGSPREGVSQVWMPCEMSYLNS